MVYNICLLGIDNFNVIHVQALINNSYNKTNKCTNVKKIYFSYRKYNFNTSAFVGFVV